MSKNVCLSCLLVVMATTALGDDLPDAWCIVKTQLLTEQLAAAEKRHGAASRKILEPLLAVAEAQLLMDQRQDAAATYQRALSIASQPMRDVTNEYRADIALLVGTLNGIGRLHMMAGRYEAAEDVYRKALNVAQISMSQSDVEVKIARTGQSMAIAQRFPIEQQQSMLEQIFKAARKAFGKGHSEVARVLDELVVLHILKDEPRRAIKLSEEAVRIRRHALGPYHPDLADTLNRLASLYHDEKKYEKALKPLQEALRIRQKAFGPKHAKVTHSLTNLARVYRDLKKVELAAELEAQAGKSAAK